MLPNDLTLRFVAEHLQIKSTAIMSHQARRTVKQPALIERVGAVAGYGAIIVKQHPIVDDIVGIVERDERVVQ